MATRKTNEWYLNGINQRSSEVLKAIFSDFFPMIKNHILKNSGDDAAAQDIFMDAIEVIYRKVQQDKLVLTSKFSSYLFVICKQLWLNVLRKNKKVNKRVTIDDPVVSNRVEELSEHFETTERYKLMREKFNLLSAGCQQLLNLSWHNNRTMQEIAELMNFTYGYACKRKHQCKTKLVELVRKDDRFKDLKNPAF